MVLKQMSEEAPEPKEWWRVLVEVREAEKKRKMALRKETLDAVNRVKDHDKDKLENLIVVKPAKKNRSRSKKKKCKAESTTKTPGTLEESEQNENYSTGESSKRVTSTTDPSPFTLAFKDDSSSHGLAMKGTGYSEHTTAASTVSAAVTTPQPGGKRHRKGSKSMTQLTVNDNPNKDDSRDAAVERLKAEAPPVSLEVAREKRTTLRRERSVKIQFLRQRTLSRGSSVAGSRPATPPYRDSAPDTEIARLEEVTEASRLLTSKTKLLEQSTTASASAHKETFPATEQQWHIVTQQRRKKQRSDQVAANRSGPVRTKPSGIEKQPKAVAKSSNRSRATKNLVGEATSLSLTTQDEKLDLVVAPPKSATVSPDPNLPLSYIGAVRKADGNVSLQRLPKTDITITVHSAKGSTIKSDVTAVSPVSTHNIPRLARNTITGGCVSVQPQQEAGTTRILDEKKPKDQGRVAAALPHLNLKIPHDSTMTITDEICFPCIPQTSEVATALPLKSNIQTSQYAKADSVDENIPLQWLQISEITTIVDIPGSSEGQTDSTAVSLIRDLKISHQVRPDLADEYLTSQQQQEPHIAIPGKSDQTHHSGGSSTTTEPWYELRDDDERFADTETLKNAVAAWQDQSDDEVEDTTNHQAASRDPLFYSVNNEAYCFRDRPFVVPPKLESEENILNGTCFPEIPPLLGNPDTGELPEQVPSAAPLICRCKLHGGSRALINYDPSIHRMIIHPSLHPLPDLRNDPYHPDWLPPPKLVEHQAYEQAGYPVYRFDRVTFECALAHCRKVLKDHVRSTLLCNGCGPYTDVRYCSKEHLFEDCQTHCKICGLVPPRVVWDAWTMPSRYRRRYPAIKDIHGQRTAERQRQQAYSIHHRASDYVIFSDWDGKQAAGQECRATGKPIVFLTFKDGDPMKDTFNRLLNIAFFGKPSFLILPYPRRRSVTPLPRSVVHHTNSQPRMQTTTTPAP